MRKSIINTLLRTHPLSPSLTHSLTSRHRRLFRSRCDETYLHGDLLLEGSESLERLVHFRLRQAKFVSKRGQLAAAAAAAACLRAFVLRSECVHICLAVCSTKLRSTKVTSQRCEKHRGPGDAIHHDKAPPAALRTPACSPATATGCASHPTAEPRTSSSNAAHTLQSVHDDDHSAAAAQI